MVETLVYQGLVGLSEAMYLWLVAAGLSLIFGVLRVLNFAHGSLYMLGAYLTFYFIRLLGGNFWVGLLLGPVVVACVGWARNSFSSAGSMTSMSPSSSSSPLPSS